MSRPAPRRHRARGRAHGPRGRRPRDEQPQRLPRSPTTARAATALQPGAARGRGPRPRGRDATAGRIEAGRPGRHRRRAPCALDYATVVDRDTFQPITTLEGHALLAIAARVGPVRLIDNAPLPTPSRRADVPPRTRTMMKSKIHRATVTDANLNYVGSITVDTDLLEAADILPYEQVFVLNINTGARFETYAIEGPAGKGRHLPERRGRPAGAARRPRDRPHLRAVRRGRAAGLRAQGGARGRGEPPGRGRGARERPASSGSGDGHRPLGRRPPRPQRRRPPGDADRLRLPDRPRPRRLRPGHPPGRRQPRRGGARLRQHPRRLAGDDGPPRARRPQRHLGHARLRGPDRRQLREPRPGRRERARPGGGRAPTR